MATDNLRPCCLQARRSIVETSRDAAASAAALATDGARRLMRLARQPPVDVRLIGRSSRRRLPVPDGFELRARGVMLNSLRIDALTLRIRDVTIGPGRPVSVGARRIMARAELTEADVNWWLSNAHLPLRLRFTDDGIRARTGLAGVALGSIDVTVALEGGLLRLVPQRVAVLGIGVSTAGFPTTPLPLPPLPRSARLTALVTAPGSMVATLHLPRGRSDVGPHAVREMLALARSGRASIGTQPRPSHAGRATPRSPGWQDNQRRAYGVDLA